MAIFDKVANKLGLMDKTYFGDREVKEISEEDPLQLVTLTFADGSPATEVVNVKEWNEGKTSKPVIAPADIQKWFVKRTTPIRVAVAEAFKKFNPRYSDIEKIILWIGEGYNQGFKQAKSAAFGVKDFESEIALEKIFEIAEASGQTLPELTEIEQDLLVVLKKHNVKPASVIDETLFRALNGKIEQVLDIAVESRMGNSPYLIRTEELDSLLSRYAQENTEQGQQGVAESEPVKSDDVSSQDAPGVEGKTDEGKQEAAAPSV
ncbi:MAG: hypothetical protein WC776_04890 [Patescibacteria group bacterium]|jgi:hypothetical protein